MMRDIRPGQAPARDAGPNPAAKTGIQFSDQRPGRDLHRRRHAFQHLPQLEQPRPDAVFGRDRPPVGAPPAPEGLIGCSPVKIGPYTLVSPVYVAPMAGVTDAPFRKIAREFGAGLACTEMISSEALVRRHRESFRLMDLHWDQRPVSVQLMGGDPQVMAQAARLAEAAGADIVDINMGCPVPKVVKTSGGSSLLRDPDRAVRVAEAVVGAGSGPGTGKIRLGWGFTTRNYPEMAEPLGATGIQGLAVHGRTRSQRYDPSADWEAIAQVKAAVSIPVAGRGDLRTGDDAVRSIRQSGVDAVMLGRGILGNLWLVRQTVARLTTGEALPALSWL